MDVAIRCFTAAQTLITTTIDRIVGATHPISRRRIRRISHAPINPSKAMAAIIRVLDPHQTMAEQHTTILLLAEVLQVGEDHLRARSIIHMALAEEAAMDQATEGLVETMKAMEATVVAEEHPRDEVVMVVTVVTEDRWPMVIVASEAVETHTTIPGVEVGVDIDIDTI